MRLTYRGDLINNNICVFNCVFVCVCVCMCVCMQLV
jgi:hypothetical protein